MSQGVKRSGLLDASGVDIFDGLKGKKIKAATSEGEKKKAEVQRMAAEYSAAYARGHVADDAPFIGAQPKLLRKPEIATPAETARKTAVAMKTLQKLIETAPQGVHIILGQDASNSPVARSLMDACVDEADPEKASVMLSMNDDWLHTLPYVQPPVRPEPGGRVLIYIGTPGKYMTMCIRSHKTRADHAYKGNRLVVVCRGVCMLPLGTQEQNIFGVDSDAIFDSIAKAARLQGDIVWGHGVGTRAPLMQKAFGYPQAEPTPKPCSFDGDAGGSFTSFCYFVDYLKYLNHVKMSKPSMRVLNWYDTGLLVSVMQGYIADSGVSLLTDADGLAMLRDASIGHIISKLNQMMAVEPFSTTRGVYNFFIGDGACRLNGGVELALHLVEGYKAQSMTTLWIFNNHKWAIEDNLVADTEKEHALYNTDFYNLLSSHGRVAVCANELELREVVSFLSRHTDAYMKGTFPPGLCMVVVRGLDVTLPPVLGDIDPILKSPEMAFMRKILGKFAEGCNSRIPLYGCSAFEYIQYLHLFMEKMPEGKRYQYVCGRTDIQAAHMCGFKQPEGKCVLFINDVYGINSLGESLRFVLSGFGGKQLLIMIWHPSLMQMLDHFHLHRPPLVWPSIGPTLAKYYVRTEKDALFVDFAGSSGAEQVASTVIKGLSSGMPLVCVNVLPEQERDYVNLDIRAKTG